jgi:radical SAM superfamily enzyme YgiQ (UPF0313 family)
VVTENIMAEVQKITPTSYIILGGAHASFAPQETLERFLGAHAVMRGESEATFLQLCRYLDQGLDLPSCASKIENLVVRNVADNSQIGLRHPTDIDTIAAASSAFSLFDIEASLKINRFLPIIASRGCVYKCSFCLSPMMWKRLRIRSWERLRQELDFYRECGFYTINFRDDVFSLLRPLVPELLSYLKEHQFEWACETRLDDMDLAKIESFHDAGLSRIRVSVETIHKDSLRLINKNPRLCNIQERVQHMAKLLDVRVSFMIGIPGETYDQVKATLDFAETLYPAKCRFWAYSPLPGTPIFENPEAHGIKEILPHLQLDPYKSFISTKEMTNETINSLLQGAQKRFGYGKAREEL